MPSERKGRCGSKRTTPSFEAAKARGRAWEERWATYLVTQGHAVVPTWLLDGESGDKAPSMSTQGGELILPDMLAFGGEGRTWWECKSKTGADYYRRGGYLVTGFSRRLLRQYEQVAAATDTSVRVAFIHAAEGEARGGDYRTLRAAYSHTGALDRDGTTFFRWDALEYLADVAELRGAA